MVARLVRDQKAGGSNPTTSTTKKAPLEGAFFVVTDAEDSDTRPVRSWVTEPTVSPVGCSAKPKGRRRNQPKQAAPPGGEAAPIEAADESHHFDQEKQDALWREGS